ncbi:MAG: beta-glucosidase BglX [Bdellovibrionaceae bacterium]|nr:beta-glucosidase BglX [Pseudobdellovibrionaceae bacterium]
MRGLSGLVLGLVMGVAARAAAAPGDSPKMKPFIDQLMAKMTLQEKVGQLVQYSADMAVTGATIRADYQNEIEKGQVGSIFNAYTPAFTRQLQRLAVEKTRLKIPLLFAYDVIHGHKTIFPIPLGESASWDLSLMEKSARIAAAEASADGLHWTFAPMVDIARDPRWGRVSEGAGEDPWLGSKIAAARVRGFQGDRPGRTDSVLACVKHYAAYGAARGGRDYNIVSMGERELREDYLPPFRAAVEAGVATLMPSFNEINGIPATADPMLLQKILREEWKFQGFAVSDYTAVEELIPAGFAADGAEAARLAFRAGTDMDMQSGLYQKNLPNLVRQGKVPMAEVDRSVRRILEAKYRLGLFQDPYRFSNEDRAKGVILSPPHQEHAREISRRSIVLLKNANSVLPLKKQGTIAVIGPLADDGLNILGNWSAAGRGTKTVTLLEGLRQVGGENVRIVHARGVDLLDDEVLHQTLNEHGAGLTKDPRGAEEMRREALRVARGADVVVMALGEAESMSGEAASRTVIRLPAHQQALLRDVKATGKPVVVLLFNGRPLVLGMENEVADALVETWFLGTQAGNAIADVLFGDYNPSGKLTISFPYNEGQIPVSYLDKSTGRPMNPKVKYTTKYLDAPNEPLFPFGYGLSYTSFEISEPRLDSERLKAGQRFKVRVDVTNTGSRDGEEVVQLYIRDLVATVTRPMKQLRGFRKVFLKAGEKKELVFDLSVEDLKFYDQKMRWVAEPGTFQVMVGNSSRDVKATEFRF